MGLLNWFKKRKDTANALVEEAGLCPNCWGHQDYDGKIKKAARDRKIDINNHDSTATQAFIQSFVNTHVGGIRLQKEEGEMTCPTCNASFK